MWKPFAVLLFFICVIVKAGSVAAISFEPRDFDALVAESDQIIIGTVASTNARRTGTREIVTDFRFADLNVIKGAIAAPTLTVTMLGGTIGIEALTIAGAPTFQPGIRYLVFISGNGTVMFPLVGGPQGIFQIRKDPVSGVARVYDYSGHALCRLPGRADTAIVDQLNADANEAISENAFVDAIRTQLGIRRPQ